MLTGDQIDALPMALETAFHRMQNRITDDIVRRMKANMGEITRAADWQIYRLRELGATAEDIRSAIKDGLMLADSELDDIFEAAAESGYARDAEIYKKTGIDIAASRDGEAIAQLVDSLKKQTVDELQNITRTLGVATSNRGTTQILSLTEFYTKALDDAAFDIASGAFDYNSVLKRTVRTLTNSGIRQIIYDSVSKRTTTARIEVAARRAVMTGVSQLTGRIAEDNAAALGTDMYEVTAHEGCRITHLDWQGKWYSMADLVRVCGYGDVAGLKGANCRHDFYPVVPGVDKPTYSDEDLARIREDEITPREYNGKEYTKYEATQRQRELERTMRARRASIKALEDGGADEDDIILERASYRALSQEYTRFSKAMGLREQRERVMIDGLGNVGAGKIKESKNVFEPLDKEQKILYNDRAEVLEYRRYKELLGKNAPESFFDFLSLKYSNEWVPFKAYASSIYSGELTPLADFKLYRSTSEKIDNILVGKVTSNGLTITGKSKHFIARTIGSVEQRRNGVSVEDTLQVLTHPLKVETARTNANGKSQRFIGASAAVSVNPDTGVLIQVNPLSKRKLKEE